MIALFIVGFFAVIFLLIACDEPLPKLPPFEPPKLGGVYLPGGRELEAKRAAAKPHPASDWDSAGAKAQQVEIERLKEACKKTWERTWKIEPETRMQRILKASGAKEGYERPDPCQIVFDGVDITEIVMHHHYSRKPDYELVEAIKERLACPDL